MATTQGKHIIPTRVQHNYLIGTGVDKTLSSLVGQDFSWKASEDGKLEKIDIKNKLIFVKYKSGVTTAIDISDKLAKNSSSGFYTRNQLHLLPKFKEGSSFKQGDILATNQQFFKEDADGSQGFAAGRLTKVALMSLASTYEDSAPVIDRVRREMASDIVSEKQIALKENSKLISIKHIGDIVNIDDPLIVFEEIGDTEKEALASVDKMMTGVDSESSLFKNFGKNIIKSKYAGKIVDIKLYYNCKLDSVELQPSLKEYVVSYIDANARRGKLLSSIKHDELIELPSTGRIDSDKILGNEMHGVLVVFFIMHEEDLSIGNKISFFSACKGIISEVIPDELAPYTDYRKDDVIEAMVSPMSLISRNVPDLVLTGFANRVLVELRKQCIEELGV